VVNALIAEMARGTSEAEVSKQISALMGIKLGQNGEDSKNDFATL